MKVGLIGGVRSSFITLKKLVEYDFNIVTVFGYKPSDEVVVSGYFDLEEYCNIENLNYEPFTRINDKVDVLKKNDLDVLFVVGISQLISDEIVNFPTLGCIGFHPTALPKGRGRAPLAWLVKNVENGAANFFKITETPDAGPIFIQTPFEVNYDDDASSIEKKQFTAIEKALDEWLPSLKKGIWNPIPQDEFGVTEYGMRKPEDGLISWNSTADECIRLIRASTIPHPCAFTFLGLNKIVIRKAHIEKDLDITGTIGRILKVRKDEFLIQCENGIIWVTDYDSNDITLKVGDRLGYLPEYEIHLIKTEINFIKKYLGI